MPTRLKCLLLLLLAASSPPVWPQLREPSTVSVLVLSLFHPRTLTLRAAQPLLLRLDDATISLPANTEARVEVSGPGLTVALPHMAPALSQSLSVAPETFSLGVPAKLTRSYTGALRVSRRGAELRATVAIETELAVASIVAAESPPGAPAEFLKAQAIVSRSYLLAHPHPHPGADACDTTHCQFLRSPPPAGGPAATATRQTRGEVLTWRPNPGAPPRLVAAMYARSCGGHTRALPGRDPAAYPFYAVACDFCLRHPERWTPDPAAPAPGSERSRIAWNRAHGWSAIPSNSPGRGIGHGVGLCQLGAADLARQGRTAEEILQHFFPNTALLGLQ